MERVTKPGGVVAISTWSRISWFSIWEEAVKEAVDADYTLPPLSNIFHEDTTEVEDDRRLFQEAGLENVEVKEFRCPHPQQKSVEAATEAFMGMGNPTVQILQKGFEENFEVIRPAFERAYARKYDGVKKQQAELAILAVGQKPL